MMAKYRRKSARRKRESEQRQQIAQQRLAHATIGTALKLLASAPPGERRARRCVEPLLAAASAVTAEGPITRRTDGLRAAIRQINMMPVLGALVFDVGTAKVQLSAAMTLFLIKTLWKEQGARWEMHIDQNTTASGGTACDIHFESMQHEEVHVSIDCSKVPHAQTLVDRLNKKFRVCTYPDAKDADDLSKVLI